MKYTFYSVHHLYKVYLKCTEFLQGLESSFNIPPGGMSPAFEFWKNYCFNSPSLEPKGCCILKDQMPLSRGN